MTRAFLFHKAFLKRRPLYFNNVELHAYGTIGLHDCRSDSIKINGKELVFNFADGFKLAPVNRYNDKSWPVKTGPAQICFHAIFDEVLIDNIDVFKTLRIFGKSIFCRRIQLKCEDFIEFFESGKYELGFLTEYHDQIAAFISA